MRHIARHSFGLHARLAELTGHLLSLRLTLRIHHRYMATSLGQSIAIRCPSLPFPPVTIATVPCNSMMFAFLQAILFPS